MAKKLVPVVAPSGECTWMDTRDAAALLGLSKLPDGAKEGAGALFQNTDGKWCWSNSVDGDADSFTFRVQGSPNYRLGGTYHTHPKGRDSDKFSGNDVATANALKVPAYIRDNASGTVKRYEPGVTKTGTIPVPGQRQRAKVSDGDIVAELLARAARRDGNQ